ncbi:hypothetical protein CsatA_017251 [Cannabis sativa]
MTKSLHLCNFLLITILVLIASSNNKVDGKICKIEIDYCLNKGHDDLCEQECTKNFPQSKSICEVVPPPAKYLACKCIYQC